ncbi:MAG: hypothetical protein AAGC53_06650 [Actinomycetota bacterium]
MAERVVITRDLMDGGRFRSAVPDAVIVRRLDAPELEDATFVVLDLATGIDPALVVADGRTVVAYGAHVDTDALDAAIAAGCADAIPRSKVFRRAAELLG